MPLLRAFQSVFVARQAAMPSKRVGREEQDRNFEIAVNHINVDQAKLPHITQQSVAALKKALGHNLKKYSQPYTTSRATTMCTSWRCPRFPRSKDLSRPVLLDLWRSSLEQMLSLWRSDCLASSRETQDQRMA